MSFFSTPFDASKVEPNTGYDPIPDGTYKVMVVKAEEKATKAGGSQLVLQVVVADGQPSAKRMLFHRVNLRCPSSTKAEEIGKAELSAVCRSVGLMILRRVAEFVGKSGMVKVKSVKRQDNGEIENKVYWQAREEKVAMDSTAAVNTGAPWAR